MSTKANVTAAKPQVGGAIYVAPTTATAPTSATSELGESFALLGYVSEDGVSNSSNMDTESIKAWGGDEVLVLYQGREDEWKFGLIEATNVDVLKTVYGEDNVSGTLDTGITIQITNADLQAQMYVIDMVLRDKVKKRIVIPEAFVTAVDDVTYNDSDVIEYNTTIRATAGSDGVYHKEYIAKPANG